MPKNIVSINSNQNSIEIKIEKLPIFAKIAYAYLGIGIIMFISIFLFYVSSMPLFFNIGIPMMIVLVFLILISSAKQLKQYSVILEKQGNNLNIKKIFSKNKSEEKSIPLTQDAKLVLVKFPISIVYYQLFFCANGHIESLIPVPWDSVEKFPIIHPTMKKFLYTQENAKKISELTSIPLEESDKNFHEYMKEIKAQYVQ